MISQTPVSVTVRVYGVQDGDRGYLSICVNGDEETRGASVRRTNRVRLIVSSPPNVEFIESGTVNGQQNNSNPVPATVDRGEVGVYTTSIEDYGVAFINAEASGSAGAPDIEWKKTYGGSLDDFGYSVQQSSDGGYIIAGATYSFSTNYDMYLVKTDALGNKLWEKVFGGVSDDRGNSVQQTSDGGYIIAGHTYPYGSNYSHIYLVKTDVDGNKLWDKQFGGYGDDFGCSVQQTSDGDYIIAGSTASYGIVYSGVYLVRTDAAGNKLWEKAFRCYTDDRCSSFQQTSDGGYIIVGDTFHDGPSYLDIFLVKLKGDLDGSDTLGKRPYCLYGKGSVNLSTGNYILEQTDLTAPSIGPSLEFTRFYNSQDTYTGPQGKGWTHNYNTHLTVNSDQGIDVAYDDGHTVTFAYSDGGYVRPANCFETLEAGPDSTYILTFKDQTKYTYNTDGQLTGITDKNGNTLTLIYSDGLLASATEPAGRSLAFTYDTDSHLTGIADSAGRNVAYTYDNNGNLATVQDVLGNVIQYYYDDLGLTEIIDPEGNSILNNTYDSGSRVTQQTDGEGNITVFNYDQLPNQTVMTDPLGNTITVSYDDKYRGTSITYPGGITEIFTYDANNCPVSVTDALNHTTNYEYDGSGNLKYITDAAGHVTSMDYDQKNNLVKVINAKGKITTLTYDADQINLKEVTDPLGRITTYDFYSNGLLHTKKTPDPDPGTTIYDYQNGLPHTMTGPAGNITTYGYDNFGFPHTVTDAAGKTTTLNYDQAGNLTSVTDPLGNTTSFTYDFRHNILTKTDARGFITTYSYNGNGQLESVLDALNNVTQYNYDANTRLEEIIDARGNTATYSYNALGRLTGITDPLGNTNGFQYDDAGNLTVKTDAKGVKVLDVTYDELLNIPRKMTDALGEYVSFDEYDNLGSLTRFTDQNGVSTQLEYDDLNSLHKTTVANNNTGSQEFDTHGNRVSLIDPNDNNISFGYDSADRLRSRSTVSAGSISLEYNNRNLLSLKTNARGQITTYEYDDTGRLQSFNNPDGTTSYTYDQNGNLLTATDSTGTTWREYDALNRLFKYTDAQGNTIQYGYDAVGNLTILTYPDGKQVHYEYNAANRLTGVTDWTGRVTAYEYDANGRLVKTTRPDGTVETREYNDAGQLTQLKDTYADGSIINRYDYTYDDAGNIKTDNNTNESEPFTTNNAVLTYAADNRLDTYEGQNVQYDADGNMAVGPLAENMVNFTFDARSRLTGAGNTSYTYDALNNRVRVSDGVKQTSYTINPNAPLSQVLIQTDEENTKTYFVYGLGLIGQETGVDYRSYHFDHLGSTIALTDQSAQVTDRFRYASYGELVYRSGNTTTPFLFNGRDGVMTDACDLYYMRARYYNPVAKRFISPDTLLGGITNPQSQNRYAYCAGNPVNYVDPTGLKGIKCSKDYPIVYTRYFERFDSYEDAYQYYLSLPYRIYLQDVKNNNCLLEYGTIDLYALYKKDQYEREHYVLNELIIAEGESYDSNSKKVAIKNLQEIEFEETPILFCSNSGGASKQIRAEILAQNRAAGKAAELIVAERLVGQGSKIIGSQVSVRTPQGIRRTDHLIRDINENLIAIEVKSGNATRNAMQVAKDIFIETEGGILVGKNAGDLVGQSVKVITIIERVP